MKWIVALVAGAVGMLGITLGGTEIGNMVAAPLPAELARAFEPGFPTGPDAHRSPLVREDGSRVKLAAEWPAQRAAIRQRWMELMGPWPELLASPRVEVQGRQPRENFEQRQIRIELAKDFFQPAILLVPRGAGPWPAVVVPFYDPETSAGLAGKPRRDFGYQLAKRGFVALCLGAPGGDAFHPVTAGATCQPLSFLAYIAANAHTALTRMPEVDPARIGIVGHSYGGKWAMFASCLYDKYAAAAWSDPGIVFDEARSNVNYWEPWYLGLDPAVTRKRGLISEAAPRTGAYKRMVEEGRDLQELHALMAPRPFLVSGGAEDRPEQWAVLQQAIAVNRLLGYEHRVAMTTRPAHDPTEESNAVIYAFFEWALGGRR